MTVLRPPSNGKHICSPEPNVYLRDHGRAEEWREVTHGPGDPSPGQTFVCVFGKEYPAGTTLVCDTCGQRWTAVGPVTVNYGSQRAVERNWVHRETRRERRRRERADRRAQDQGWNTQIGVGPASRRSIAETRLPPVVNPGPADRTVEGGQQ